MWQVNQRFVFHSCVGTLAHREVCGAVVRCAPSEKRKCSHVRRIVSTITQQVRCVETSCERSCGLPVALRAISCGSAKWRLSLKSEPMVRGKRKAVRVAFVSAVVRRNTWRGRILEHSPMTRRTAMQWATPWLARAPAPLGVGSALHGALR